MRYLHPTNVHRRLYFDWCRPVSGRIKPAPKRCRAYTNTSLLCYSALVRLSGPTFGSFSFRCAMSDAPSYYAACCQTDFPAPKSRTEITSRVDRMLEMIDGAVLGYEPFFPVRLVVFPEFAHSPPVYFTVAELLER